MRATTGRSLAATGVSPRTMAARFLLFRRQSPVGMPQQPYWQTRQFVSKKKSLSIIAWSACCTAVSKPSSRSLHTPSMVVPPGEHTAFMSAIGCSELFIASAPLPITVAVAISPVIGLANPARTPASARASRIISHRRLNGCIGNFLYLKSLNNEYKLDIQQ